MAKIIGNTTATPNLRSDWNQTDETKVDYIKNKPTILTKEDIAELIPSGSGGIPVVHELLVDAKDGDMCLYAPINTITLADSGKKIYFDWKEFAKPVDSEVVVGIVAYDSTNLDAATGLEISCYRGAVGCGMGVTLYKNDGSCEVYDVTFSDGEFLAEFSKYIDIYGEEYYYNNVDELPLSLTLSEFDMFGDANVNTAGDIFMFCTEYRLMKYQGGVWSQIGTSNAGGSGDGSIDLTNYYTKQEIDDKGFITEEDLPNGGIYVGSGDMPDNCNIQIDPDGSVATIPTKTSDLENDSGFITNDKIELTTETAILQPNIYYSFGETTTLTLEFAEGDTANVNEYSFTFVSGATPTVLTLPSSVQWANELTVEANKRYEISIVDNIGLWCAVDLVVSE